MTSSDPVALIAKLIATGIDAGRSPEELSTIINAVMESRFASKLTTAFDDGYIKGVQDGREGADCGYNHPRL